MIKPASVVFHAGLLRSCGIESPRCGRVALPPVYLPVWLAIGHRKPSGPGLTLCVRMWVYARARVLVYSRVCARTTEQDLS
jgi:hypothetical protein